MRLPRKKKKALRKEGIKIVFDSRITMNRIDTFLKGMQSGRNSLTLKSKQ